MLDRVLLFMGRTVRMIIGAVIDLSIIFYVKLYMNEFGKEVFLVYIFTWLWVILEEILHPKSPRSPYSQEEWEAIRIARRQKISVVDDLLWKPVEVFLLIGLMMGIAVLSEKSKY